MKHGGIVWQLSALEGFFAYQYYSKRAGGME